MSQLLQDAITKLDIYLPWLLPAMEAVESTIPVTSRLLLCVPLMALVAVLRHHSAVTSRVRPTTY